MVCIKVWENTGYKCSYLGYREIIGAEHVIFLAHILIYQGW